MNAEPDADERQHELHRRLLAGETVFDEAMNRRKDGSVFRCQFWVSPLRDEFGNVSGYVGSQRDVTERVEAERALAHSQRMVEIGRLSGYLSQIESAAQRARELVRQLLVFGRGAPTGVCSSTPLNLMVQEAVALLRPLMPLMVDVQTRFSEPSPRVRVDPLHVQQIIVNPGVNARDAMCDKGTLRISVDTASINEGIPCSTCRLPVVGDWARIRVYDIGQGIPAEILERIFSPFFTTKPVGVGSGMGLAVVAGLVRGCEGQ